MGLFKKKIVNQGSITINKEDLTFRINGGKIYNEKKHGLLRATANLATLGAFGLVEQANSTGKFSRKWHSFKELISAELVQDDESVTKVNLGSALMFGIFASRTNKKLIANMYVKVVLDDLDSPCIMIPYITKPTKISNKNYKKALEMAQKTLSAFDVILNQKNKLEELEDEPIEYIESTDEKDDSEIDKVSQPEKTPVEQIKEYKELLDLGIISQEEFDAKKKELLNL